MYVVSQPGSEYTMGFSALDDFLRQFVQLNPTSRSLFVRNETTKVFEACFLLMPGIAQILSHSWENTIALDMGFLVTKKGFGANMVAMCISTSEHRNLSIGTGIVGIENSANYEICLETVNKNEDVKLLINTKERVIRFDRHRSIPKAVRKAWPEATQCFDPIHIARNCRTCCGAACNLNSYWQAVYALTRADFEQHWAQLVLDSPKVANYLRNLDKAKYCNYVLVESGMVLHGVYTSNPAEVTIASAGRINARHVEPTKYMSVAVQTFQKNVCFHQSIVEKSISCGAILTPYANDHLLRRV
jgi:hypothetical protein